MSQATASVARMSAPSAHPFSPPDIVLQTDPEDERIWVPLKEGVWLRPLMYNTVQGGWCEVVKVTGGGFVSRHRHPAPVHGLVLKGAFRYLEHDWIADRGTYIYEPPGEVHTLVVDDDCPEMHCFLRDLRLGQLCGRGWPGRPRRGCLPPPRPRARALRGGRPRRRLRQELRALGVLAAGVRRKSGSQASEPGAS